jgi:hypothetical protein
MTKRLVGRLAIAVSAIGSSIFGGWAISGWTTVASAQGDAPSEASSFGQVLHLPIMYFDHPATPAPDPTPGPTPEPRAPDQTAFGIEMESIDRGGEIVATAGTTWVRRNGLLWDAVEATQGQRDWSRVASLEAELARASGLNLEVVLIVRGTPSWARKHSNSPCGPIRNDRLAAFGDFMRDAVARYSKPPFNIKYWELGNEPDAPVYYGEMPYGCWGEPTDDFFGGTYYARMLRATYPQIKAADPEARVLIGGLMMVCDPEPVERRWTCGNEKFFEGILAGGGGPYFDGVSFHTYDYFAGDIGTYDQQGWLSAWDTTGPVVIAKTRYIRRVLSRYGVEGKFLMNTEMALICWDCPPLERHEITKAYYVAQSFAATIAEGLTASIWYILFGWQGSHLLIGNYEPTLAFTAFTVARSKLGDVTYVEPIRPSDVGGSTDVLGYKFKRSGRDVWVIWSKDGQTQSIRFPTRPSSLTGALGAAIQPDIDYDLTVAPVYVEW